MSAAPIQSNVPADMRQDSQPYYIPERDAIIPRFYQAAQHDGQLDAKVAYEGMPIVIGGETLTVGLVPPERRWAIGPAQDGWAHCVDQKQFDELCILWKQQEIAFKSQGKEVLDFPHLEARPNVRDFVSWKVHATDPSKLIRLGMPHQRQVVRQGTHVYDPETDTQMTRDEWAAREKAKLAKPSADADRIAALEAKIAELTGAPAAAVSPATEALVAAAKPKREAKKVAQPCGKEIDPRGVRFHVKSCPDCQAATPKETE